MQRTLTTPSGDTITLTRTRHGLINVAVKDDTMLLDDVQLPDEVTPEWCAEQAARLDALVEVNLHDATWKDCAVNREAARSEAVFNRYTARGWRKLGELLAA